MSEFTYYCVVIVLALKAVDECPNTGISYANKVVKGVHFHEANKDAIDQGRMGGFVPCFPFLHPVAKDLEGTLPLPLLAFLLPPSLRPTQKPLRFLSRRPRCLRQTPSLFNTSALETPNLEYPNWQHWIKPLPDGSGFYRIEFREREAVIYFHPLPSPKR